MRYKFRSLGQVKGIPIFVEYLKQRGKGVKKGSKKESDFLEFPVFLG
jgi:hypothetical protein